MSCGGASAGSDDDIFLGSGSSGYVYRPSPEDIRRRQERDMKRERKKYEASISSARKENDYKLRVKHYNDAMKHVRKYWDIYKRSGLNPCSMPDIYHALPDIDVKWLGERHYNSLSNIVLFSIDERDALENILKRSGNRCMIEDNISRYQDSCRAYAKERMKHKIISFTF